MSFLPTFVMPASNDASLNYLAGILGHQVINDITGGTTNPALVLDSHIFARMMDVFNHLLLGGGLLIFSILLFVGTMNTAADGQFLGRNWHSVWTPLRLVFGILLVVPLKTGYCIGQYIILYAILIGVHFATTVWQHAINDVFNNQDTPPPPTYLTTEVQQVLGQALNALVVPYILQASGLAQQGGNDQLVQVTIPDSTYDIGQNNLPPEIKDSIVRDITGPNGICNSLYSAYSSNCASAVANAFNAAAHGFGFYEDNNIITEVGVGTDYPVAPSSGQNWFNSFAFGMSPTFWNHPNGKIEVYGAYVYDTSKIFSGFSNNVPDKCKDSGSQPSSPGTVPCEDLPSNQGAQDAYAAVKKVVDGAIIQPATAVNSAGGMSSDSVTALKDFCQTDVDWSVPDVDHPDKTITVQASPCDLQFAVQGIMEEAKEYAQTKAETLAPYVGQWDPSLPQCTDKITKDCNTLSPMQASSTPESSDDSPHEVPPDGAAAIANNMYIYTDKNNQLRVGYNLNDYWISDIDGKSYIDLQMNNSWWMAGSSYLVLDNILGQNLAWMAESIQNELNLFQQAVGGATLDPDLSYNCNGAANFKIDGNSAHYKGFVTPEFCVNYGIRVLERDVSLSGGQNDKGVFEPSASMIGSGDPIYESDCQRYKKDSNQTEYYTCALDLLRASTPSVRVAKYNGSNIAVATWQDLIGPYNPNTPNEKYHVDTSNNIYFYQQLMSMPADFQGPIAVLLQIASNQADQGGYQKLYPYLVTLINVLQYNGLLSNSQVESALPVNHAINNIFNQLVGGKAGVGSTGSAEEIATQVNTIMQQVYNLGLTDNSRGVIAAQFSLIQQAQTAGISMIMACVTSMEAVYNAYTATLQGMINQVNSIATEGQAQDRAFAIAGMAPIVGPIFNMLSENDVRARELSIMTTTVTTITNISVQLMWLPLLVFIMTSLFTAGVQFAILVPLMPYILFWAGQIAWLIGVIEAVVAAPLVMLGLAHPGGHEFMGHTVPAVKMLIGVMFRPVLMVIGLIVGILLTYIVINFSAQGFHTVAAGILNAVPQREVTVQGIMACLLLFIYATFLVMAFQKCFSTIYMIPEQVVQWIGGQASRAGPDELQQISGATQQTAQGAASAGGQTLEKGISAQQQRAQGMSDVSKQSMRTSFETNRALGQSVKQGLGEGVEIVKMMF